MDRPSMIHVGRSVRNARAGIAFVLGLLALALAAPTLAAAQAPSPEVDVEGEWSLSMRDAESRIDAAIQRVTDRMNIFVREIARGQIDGRVDPEQRVHVRRQGEHLVVTRDGWGPVRVPLDGRTVRAAGANGAPLRIRARVRADRLVLHEITNEGTRTVTLVPRGDRLTIATRIHSDQLPADITYHLTYRRASSAQIASR